MLWRQSELPGSVIHRRPVNGLRAAFAEPVASAAERNETAQAYNPKTALMSSGAHQCWHDTKWFQTWLGLARASNS